MKNNKFYIGSSKNIFRRWAKHKALLRHGKHDNAHLQASWDKYGEEAFGFTIVCLCSEESLLCKEQYYIDTLKPQYNITQIAGKVEMTDEIRYKISKATKQAYMDGKLNPVKHVYQYDLKGNYIREYNSLTIASEELNIPISNLSSALHEKCNIAGGFVWRFYKVDKLDVWFNRMGRPLTKEPYRKKMIQFKVEHEGKVLTFNSPKEISDYLHCTMNQIYKAISLGRLINKQFKVIKHYVR